MSISPHYTFIPPDLEGTYRHFSLRLGTLYKSLLIGTTVAAFIGLLFSQRTLYAGKENFEMENGVWNMSFIEGRKNLGFNGKVTLRETVESLDPAHPLHHLETRQHDYNWISYDFGSQIHNYCQRIAFPSVKTFPSFLRLLEFRADAQLFFRTAVLGALCVRMFLSTVCGNYVWNLFNYRRSVRWATVWLPFFDFSWMSWAMLVLCLQKDQDRLMKSLMFWHLPLFAASFVVYAVLYTLLTATVFQKFWRAALQFGCVCFFCASFPHVYDSYLKLLQDGGKPCYVDVPVFDALAEYLAIASVFAFVCLQFKELVPFEGIITLCKMEYDDYFSHTPKYTPAFSLEESSPSLCSTSNSRMNRTDSTSS